MGGQGRVRQSAGAREHCSKAASCLVGSRAKKRRGKTGKKGDKKEKEKKEGKKERREKRKEKERERKKIQKGKKKESNNLLSYCLQNILPSDFYIKI